MPRSLSLLVPLLVYLLPIVNAAASANAERKMFIVYMGNKPENNVDVTSEHHRILEQVAGREATQLLVHSYTRSFNGFVAKLFDHEANEIAKMDNVVSVFPSEKRKLHTTRSWSFMGFPANVTRKAYESDVIIGMLDTGIWPESKSFTDEGIGPPPSKWKGICQSPSNFTCNKKIIGARYYHIDSNIVEGEIESPRDSEGHGSHTSSTAAGRLVGDSSLYGLAEGTARGGVPSARIAVYKVCWDNGCSDADILAAFDDAIADGVDILSISLGSLIAWDYFEDTIAIGAFHAMKKGIFTSNSGGNSGPLMYTIENNSPWSLTVAASTIDRRFVADVLLGNGKSYEGVSVNTFQPKDKEYKLVYGGNCPNTSAGYVGETSKYCYEGSLDRNLVEGAIVLCDSSNSVIGPLDVGAAGTVLQSSVDMNYAFSYPLPASVLDTSDAANVSLYINTTSNPTAVISKGEGIHDPNAPYAASFSSRGPNQITAGILKPDLTAPGVDILAAWSPIASFTGYEFDTRSVAYNIISGTSMSCPHATGAAGYVKSFHPTWSPAAIKSALMTTANPMNASLSSGAEFAYGSGHINPVAAVDPGLVYDLEEAEYVSFLCGQGYSTKRLRLVTGDNSSCTSTNNGTVWDFNYPSFVLHAKTGMPFSQSFNRTLTNVGSPKSVYKASIESHTDAKIDVVPSTISFSSLLEKQSFTLEIEGKTTQGILSASLVWDDGIHRARSPIVVYTI